VAAADADLAPHVAAVRVGDIADDNDLGGWAGGGKGGRGGVPRLVRPADAHLHVHTYVMEGGSGWRGVPPPPAGGAAPPAATRAPTATPLTAPKSEPESLPSV